MSTNVLAVVAVALGVCLLAANGPLSRLSFGEQSRWPEMDEGLRRRGNRVTNPPSLYTVRFRRTLARIFYGVAALWLIWAGLKHLV